MKPLKFIILALLTAFPASALQITERQATDALLRLDHELDMRDSYIGRRQASIDSLRRVFDSATNPRKRLGLMMVLGDRYTSFNNDSALYYFHQGVELAQQIGAQPECVAFHLKRATLLPLAAFVAEAEREYTSIDPSTLSPELLELYYRAGRQMYSYIAAYYTGYPDVHKRWYQKSLDAHTQLIEILPKESPRYKVNKGEYYLLNKEYSKAKVLLAEVLDQIPESDNLYARAAHMLADIARARGNDVEYRYYLTLSAIADTKGATLEVMSLQELGQVMMDDGDVDRAHRYLSLALAGAVACHATLRVIQSADALPFIEKAHSVEIKAWQNHSRGIIITIIIVALGLVITLLLLRHEMRRMRAMQSKLRSANQIKEVYISQFLNLCSIYMDKLNQFSKTVNRKIAANKIDDLFKITKSGKFVEEQSKEFYDVFDNAFLHIYPNFVKSVNALLRPDEQITLKEDEILNTDLRILAFMRLGIQESTRIAQVLNYSVYTIYTYRNKMKNKAINRDTFERDVMHISSMEEED